MQGGSSFKTSGRISNTENDLLSLGPATCQMVGLFAWRRTAQAVVTQSQSNAYSAQNRSVLSESQDGCWGMNKWYLAWWRENLPMIYSWESTGKMLELCVFPFSFHLDFPFEWNEVCMQAGRGEQGWWDIARRRKDILHLHIQSVVFSNFEKEEDKC